MVASLGFEPRQADSESAVLPLHHEAINGPHKIPNYRCEASTNAMGETQRVGAAAIGF